MLNIFPSLKNFGAINCFGNRVVNSVAIHALTRPDQNEQRMHSSAQRHDLALQCEIRHLQLPMVTDYDDNDDPIVEMLSWPFVLPHLLVL